MRQETFSASEVEAKLKEGWSIVKENIIAGKVRTVVMQKEGNKFEFVEGEEKAKEEYIKSLKPADRKRYLESEKLRKRGFDF